MQKKKRALICGVSGQDGSYLARYLLEKNYDVFGSSRDSQLSNFSNLNRLGIIEKVHTLSMAPNDFRSVLHILDLVKPDEIYYLAGQSSVALSFEQPVETIESIATATLNLLEAIRFLGRDIKLYNAGSGECYGEANGIRATESTPFNPRSPYAIAKVSSFHLIKNYREAYGLKACTGLLFNHESPLRPERFVTKKIVSTARRISEGSGERLKLGNTKIIRDWGWAPEYVEAMWLMLQQDEMNDLIIGTGNSVSLETFISLVFSKFCLDWQEHVEIDDSLFRPTDVLESRCSPEKASELIGWHAKLQVKEIVDHLVQDQS
jgi:GDPmannose 4,6-dehydratase